MVDSWRTNELEQRQTTTQLDCCGLKKNHDSNCLAEQSTCSCHFLWRWWLWLILLGTNCRHRRGTAPAPAAALGRLLFHRHGSFVVHVCRQQSQDMFLDRHGRTVVAAAAHVWLFVIVPLRKHHGPRGGNDGWSLIEIYIIPESKESKSVGEYVSRVKIQQHTVKVEKKSKSYPVDSI